MRLFGTDGIRDIANQGALTPAMLVRIGAACGQILQSYQKTGNPIVLMGEDGRASGLMIRFALSAGLLGEGVHVVHGGIMTTPALAVMTSTREFSAGVMISASHNPAHHNGIKLFGPDSSKIPDEIEERIEQIVAAPTPGIEGEPPLPGTAKRDDQLLDTYCRFITAELVPDLFLGSFKVVLDCANGGSSCCAPKVLSELGTDLHVLHNQPDGTNINLKCGSNHAGLLANTVRGEKADIGICLDGDGDRCILLDENGNTIDGDRILMILARHLHEKDELAANTLVYTIMSNLGLKKAMHALGVETVVTPVGDRSVVKSMREKKAVLGGEQSGHIIINQKGRFIGDGLVAALRVMEVMKEKDMPLSKLVEDFTSYPQIRINLDVKEKVPFDTLPRVNQAVAAAEKELGTEGRVLLRYSGTEKMARIMVEGPDEGQVKGLAKSIEDALKESLC